MMARSRESDNVLRFYPVGWRRPVTIMGPGAGPPETVTGILAGLGRVRERC
jgi:homoserine dehydrogenase